MCNCASHTFKIRLCQARAGLMVDSLIIPQKPNLMESARLYRVYDTFLGNSDSMDHSVGAWWQKCLHTFLAWETLMYIITNE